MIMDIFYKDGRVMGDSAVQIFQRDSGLIIPRWNCTLIPPTDIGTLFNTLKNIYHTVRDTGQYNFQKARLTLPQGFNIQLWRTLLVDYPDNHICDFLEYGWPLNYVLSTPPSITDDSNHASSLAFPEDIQEYLDKEVYYEAIIGPLDQPLFSDWNHISPLLSRPKKSGKRRTILNLSWPDGHSTNSGIPTNEYLDLPYKLVLPTVQDLEKLIIEYGQGTYLYAMDISRAYAQIRIDPLDWPLVSFKWDNKWYNHLNCPFGARTGSNFCQQTMESICYILARKVNDGKCT